MTFSPLVISSVTSINDFPGFLFIDFIFFLFSSVFPSHSPVILSSVLANVQENHVLISMLVYQLRSLTEK